MARIACASAIGIVAMKTATGSPMQKDTERLPETLDLESPDDRADEGSDHPEDADERRDECPRSKRSVVRHVLPPRRSLADATRLLRTSVNRAHGLDRVRFRR